jgi:hypothetical protein
MSSFLEAQADVLNHFWIQVAVSERSRRMAVSEVKRPSHDCSEVKRPEKVPVRV